MLRKLFVEAYFCRQEPGGGENLIKKDSKPKHVPSVFSMIPTAYGEVTNRKHLVSSPFCYLEADARSNTHVGKRVESEFKFIEL